MTDLRALTSRYTAVWRDAVEFTDYGRYAGLDEMEARVTAAQEEFVAFPPPPRNHRMGVQGAKPPGGGPGVRPPDNTTKAETAASVPREQVPAFGRVEVPGIEPGSSGALPRLLRAQFALPLLGPTGHANKPV